MIDETTGPAAARAALRDRIAELEGRLARLEAAARPFAAYVRCLDGNRPYGDACALRLDFEMDPAGRPTLGDLRRLAAALE